MENGNTMAIEPPPPPSLSPSPSPSQQLTELIQALDQATQMAKQLPIAASNPDQHRLIFTSLQSAHISLSSFLSLHHHNHHYHHPDNSVSSAVADDPMIDGDGDGEEEEHNSKDSSMERVEEKIRECLYIQNKRPKRPLSPSTAAVSERQGLDERESSRVPADFDPHGTRLRNLDLVYQFHG